MNFKSDFLIISILFLCFGLEAFTQEQIRGKVFDQTTGSVLKGVSIQCENKGTTTDVNGFFEIDEELEEGIVLKFSFLGYKSQEIVFKKPSKFLNVALQINEFELGEILIAVYQTHQKLMKIPGPITVITERELRRDNEVALTPILNRVPGVYMQSGALNTNRISIRGVGARSPFGTNKIRAYLNDIPLTDGVGETTIEDIDLSLVDKLEIIKGPASSIYGAGLGGTIGMNFKKADLNSAPLLSSFSFGSFGLFRNVERFTTSGNQYNLALTFSTVLNDGYRDNNEYRRNSLAAGGQYFLSENTTLSFLANWIALKAFIPSSIDSITFANDPSAAAPNWAAVKGYEDYQKGLFGLNLHHESKTSLSNSTSLFTSFRNAEEVRPFNNIDEDNKAYGMRTNFRYHFPEEKILIKFSFGAEFFSELYQWQTFESLQGDWGVLLSKNKERRRYFNLFGQLDLNLTAKTFLTLGLNTNFSNYRLDNEFNSSGEDLSGSRTFEPVYSPRIALNHQLLPEISAYASVSHGFSPPSLEETLTPEGDVNPDIQPEKGWNFEIGSRGEVFERKLFYDVSVFNLQIKDLLVARRVDEDAYQGINAGETRHKGLEMALNYQVFRQPQGNFQRLQLYANYLLNDYTFVDFVDDQNDYSGNDLTGMPKHIFTAGMDLELISGFYGNLNSQYTSEMPMNDDNSKYSEAYSLFNVKIGFKRTFVNHFSLDASFGVGNLFDQKYASMIAINARGFGGNAPRYYYPGLPRNFFGGIQILYAFR